MSTTAILILNWNGSGDTISCFRSLENQLTAQDYLFIIDNGSTDNSVNEIKKHFNSAKLSFILCGAEDLKTSFIKQNKIYIIRNTQNLGFGAGNNVVLKQLKHLSNDFDFAWLLNNDALVVNNALNSLKTCLQNNQTLGAVGSLILNYPDNGTIQCSGVKHYKFFGVSKLINKNMPYVNFDKSSKIAFDYLNGASLMFSVNALEEVGCFDERFFLYSEELDLQLRLLKKKYTLHLDLNSVVYHKLGQATRSKRYLFFYYYNASAVMLSKKHYTYYYTVTAVINLALITFIRAMPSVKSFKWGLKGILKGLKTK